jgi:translation initiation factor 1 (eIF-1/SUI1)
MKHDMACSCAREKNNLEVQGQNGYCACNSHNG